MATYKTSDAVGERESLSDVIQRIDPDETPIFSNAAKETTSAVTHDWQVQELTLPPQIIMLMRAQISVIRIPPPRSDYQMSTR